ncbi:glycoside hydrolase family 16 protein [Undibacterium sp. TC4M20W]|uniref:glycoside hydrolase family 16 protein n=1 Tax=unclassified Undibacterium TaxID=2630295 RepID=UPI003BF1C1CE
MKKMMFAVLALHMWSANAASQLWEPIMDRGTSFVPSGYTLVFNDEFNGATLNRERWSTRYIYANGTVDYLNETELERYRDNNNHVLHDGMLSLTARKVGPGKYESGMIRSNWETKYGYFEASVRMPGGKGVFPAFWLNSGKRKSDGRLYWGPEIDIFEFVVNGVEDNPGPFKNMLHSGVQTHGGKIESRLLAKGPRFDTQWNNYYANEDLTKGFHTVGLEWTPTDVTVYVDGHLLYQRTYRWLYNDDLTEAGPAHVLLNLAIGGGWAGRYGVDDSVFPQSLDIDWVRVYKKVGGYPPG